MYILKHQRQVFGAVLEKLSRDHVVLLIDYATNYNHKSREAAQRPFRHVRLVSDNRVSILGI
jgi:hypothetical protein